MATSRKIIIEEWVSLDGFYCDKNDSLDFFTSTIRETYLDTGQQEHLENIDCMLFGRKTYEQFASVWPDRAIEQNLLATKINTEQKIVFSKSRTVAPWGKWPQATIENGNAITIIKELKLLNGKNMVVWGSVSLAQVLLKEKLVDELRIHVCPVILSGGKKLFSEVIGDARLDLVESKSFDDGNVLLRYQLK